MRQIAPAARARAERELADIQQVIDNEGGGFRATAWDWLLLQRAGAAGCLCH